jgi:hypothetical protein
LLYRIGGWVVRRKGDAFLHHYIVLRGGQIEIEARYTRLAKRAGGAAIGNQEIYRARKLAALLAQQDVGRIDADLQMHAFLVAFRG